MSSNLKTSGQILLATTGMDNEPWLGILRKIAPNRCPIDFVDNNNIENIRFAIAWKPAPGSLRKLPNLKAIFSLGAGVDHIVSDKTLPDVPIVRVIANDLTDRMGEYIVWQVLTHHRSALQYSAQQKQHLWQEISQPAAQAVTVGIMGMGVLGAHCANILATIGFNVIGWSRSVKDVENVKCFAGNTELDEFLDQTDILVVLLPLTDQTAGIIDKKLIHKLSLTSRQNGPFIVNAGRGGLQVESDILAALKDGSLGGVSLDVFQSEPLNPGSELWSHPKAVITPHIAAVSDPASLVPDMVNQMDGFEEGKTLRNLVDRSNSY